MPFIWFYKFLLATSGIVRTVHVHRAVQCESLHKNREAKEHASHPVTNTFLSLAIRLIVGIQGFVGIQGIVQVPVVECNRKLERGRGVCMTERG